MLQSTPVFGIMKEKVFTDNLNTAVITMAFYRLTFKPAIGLYEIGRAHV